MKYPVTPDGRYFVVRGRLWRMTDPSIGEEERSKLTKRLMTARRAVRDAKAEGTRTLRPRRIARWTGRKRGLGERGPAWWKDGAPDFNRHMAKNTPYAEWYAKLKPSQSSPCRGN